MHREPPLHGEIPELRLCGVLTGGAREDGQLGGRDASIPVRVEQREGKDRYSLRSDVVF